MGILVLFLILSFIFVAECGMKNESEVQVRVAFWGTPEEIDIIKGTVEPWDKATTNINAKLEHIPSGTPYIQKLLSEMAGGTAPDVAFIEVNNFVDNIPLIFIIYLSCQKYIIYLIENRTVLQTTGI